MPSELPQTPDYETQSHRPILQDDEILVGMRKQCSNGKIAVYPGEMIITTYWCEIPHLENKEDGWFESTPVKVVVTSFAKRGG